MRKIIGTMALFGLLAAMPVSAQIINIYDSTDTEAEVGVGSSTSTEAKAEAEIKADAEADKNDEDESSASTEAGAKTDLGVSVSARDIEEMDAEARVEFLLSVKSHAEVRSEQDLENFARGILLADENVKAVGSNKSEVSITYGVPAKFLGFIKSSMPVKVKVMAEAEANAEAEEQVEVDMPWYAFLFDIPEGLTNAELKADAESRVGAFARGKTEFNEREQAQILSEIQATLDGKLEVDAEASS